MSNQQNKLYILQFIIPLLYGLAYYFLRNAQLLDPLLSTILFVVGMYLGIIILWLDNQWLFQYYLQKPPKQLITRSLVFVLSLIPLGVYLISSTGSALGVGVYLGLIIGLLSEMILTFSDSKLFEEKFLFQLNREINSKDIDWYMRIFIIFACIVSILVLF